MAETIFSLKINRRPITDTADIGLPRSFFECVAGYQEQDVPEIVCALHNLLNFLSNQVGNPMQLNRLSPEQFQALQEPVGPPLSVGVTNGHSGDRTTA